MRNLFFIILLGVTAPVFCQNEKHGNSTPWEAFAGYSQPIGKWSDEVDFYEVNGIGAPVYYSSFASRTGAHARNGFNAGLCYNLTFLKKSGRQHAFGVQLYPFIFDIFFYDLRSNGPAIASEAIKPILQYEAALAPYFTAGVGSGSIKFLIRSGLAIKKTSGEVHFVSQGNSVSNNLFIDYTTYSYSGVGATFAPGVKYTIGRIGIGAEMHFELTSGKYNGQAFYNDAAGDPSPYKPSFKIENTVFRSRYLNFNLSYAFGFGK
ncbi:MAG: hypothetical protein M3R17_10930 [Bacteroidota bacterium]|nr:hypothetical protein [Bacteroidota bacterium]